MAKSNKRYRRKRQQSFPWLPFGVGFLLIGLAVVLLALAKVR